MASAKSVGNKLGRGAGWVGATLWTGTCLIAEATGEFGEGFLEGAEAGYEDRTQVMLANDAARKARRAQAAAALLANDAARKARRAQAAAALLANRIAADKQLSAPITAVTA